MFMRFLQIKLRADVVDKFKKFYQEVVYPELQKMEGCLFASLMKNGPQPDEFISLTFWDTEKNAELYETSGTFQKLIDQSSPFFSESAEWKIQLSENLELEYKPVATEPSLKKYSVAVQSNNLKGIKAQPTTMYVRIVSLKTQEGKAEEFKKIYLEEIIPSLKATPGCSNIYLTESVAGGNDFISITIWNSKNDADHYEQSGHFAELLKKVEHTFSHFYRWKMTLEKDYSAFVKTSEDISVEGYSVVLGKNFK